MGPSRFNSARDAQGHFLRSSKAKKQAWAVLCLVHGSWVSGLNTHRSLVWWSLCLPPACHPHVAADSERDRGLQSPTSHGSATTQLSPMLNLRTRELRRQSCSTPAQRGLAPQPEDRLGLQTLSCQLLLGQHPRMC